MADFADIVAEIKNTNEKLDKLTEATDPSGAAAVEDKREAARSQRAAEGYLQTIAAAMAPPPPGTGPTEGGEDKKAGGIFGGVGRAFGKLGKGVGKGISGFMGGIAKGLPYVIAFPAVMLALGTGIGAFIGAIAVVAGGALWVVSKMMPDMAAGLKSFEDVDGKNLKEVGDGLVALGLGFVSMGAGAAIQGIGNLVGGITDSIGGLFGIEPGGKRMIDNLIAFSELDIDAEKVENNANALAAYGVAMAKGATGDVLASLAGFVGAAFDGLTNLLGGVPLLDKLKLFGAEAVNKANVINNAEAMEHYMLAMVRGAGAQTAEALGAVAGFATAAFDGLTRLIGGKSFLENTLDGLKKMSAAADSIDKTNVGNVAAAMASYTEAMALGAAGEGFKAVGSIFNFVSSAADGLTRLIGGGNVLDTQLESLKKMSKAAADIDPVNVSNVASAMASYAKAMALGAGAEGVKAAGSIANFVGTAVDGLTSWIFGGEKKSSMDVMLEGLRKLSDTTGINAANVENNATAMASYAKAMALGAGAEGALALGDIAGFVGGIVNSIGSFFGIENKDPITELKKFAAIEITAAEVTQIEANAKAMESYAGAMIAVGKVEGITAWGEFDKLFGGLVKNISGWLGIKKEPGPLDKLKTFAAIIVTPAEVLQIQANASALEVYSAAMVTAQAAAPDTTVFGAVGELISGVVGNVGKWLGVTPGDGPLDKLKKFAAKIITPAEVTQINFNASALQAYSSAMEAASKAAPKKDIWDSLGALFSGILGSLTNIFSSDKDPMDMMKKFASKGLTEGELNQITRNSDAFKVYSEAMRSISEAGAAFEGGDVPDLKEFAEQLDASSIPLNSAMTKFGDPALFEKYSQSGQNLGALFSAFKDIEGMGSSTFMGSSDIEDFADDLAESLPKLELAIMGKGDKKGLTSSDIKWSDAAKNINVLLKAFNMSSDLGTGEIEGQGFGRQSGGPITAGKPYMVGEGGPEMIIPSTAGQVLNAQRTERMQQASLRNSMKTMSGGQAVLNNMPVSNISTNQSNTTITTTPLMHPSPIIGMVNSAT